MADKNGVAEGISGVVEGVKGKVKEAVDTVSDKVKDVRITHRLTDSPACLVADEHDMGMNLARLMKAAGQNMPISKPILEINPSHPVVLRLKYEDAQFDDWAAVLFDQALLAEDEAGELKAFLFAIPDLAQGPKPKAVILKTYASRVKGGGSMLANAFHERAKKRGFTEVIHALMHESNLSATHSGNAGGSVFRRYALWGGRL